MAQPAAPEDSTNSAKQERPKPQIIYHLSSVSHETAGALHAQSKAADMSLEIGPNMPISLQLARANANAAATSASPPAEATPNAKIERGNKKGKASARRGSGSGRGRALKRGEGNGAHGKRHGRSR